MRVQRTPWRAPPPHRGAQDAGSGPTRCSLARTLISQVFDERDGPVVLKDGAEELGLRERGGGR